MLKKIIQKASKLHTNSMYTIMESAEKVSSSAVDIKEKAQTEIMSFISNNEERVKELIGDKVINDATLALLYHRLPFPVKIVISEKVFVGLILDDDSVIKTTLQKLSTAAKGVNENVDAEATLDEYLEADIEPNSLLGKAKDTILAKATQIAVNSQMKKFGKMLNLTLNSKAKNIDLEVMLDGEYEPLSIYIRNYEIVEDNDKHFIKIQNIVTSRAWIDEAVVPRLEGRTFELPSKYIKLIKMAI